MNIKEANFFISNCIGQEIMITRNNGTTSKEVIKRVIPMIDSIGLLYDVEVLYNKSRNYYFSTNAILKKQSHIKRVSFNGIRQRGMQALKKKPIADYISRKMDDSTTIQVAMKIKQVIKQEQ